MNYWHKYGQIAVRPSTKSKYFGYIIKKAWHSIILRQSGWTNSEMKHLVAIKETIYLQAGQQKTSESIKRFKK